MGADALLGCKGLDGCGIEGEGCCDGGGAWLLLSALDERLSEVPRPSMTWALLLQGVTRGWDGEVAVVVVMFVWAGGQEKGRGRGSDLTAVVEGSGVSSTGSGLGAGEGWWCGLCGE